MCEHTLMREKKRGSETSEYVESFSILFGIVVGIINEVVFGRATHIIYIFCQSEIC